MNFEVLMALCDYMVACEEEHTLLLFQHLLSKDFAYHPAELLFEPGLIWPAVCVQVID